MFSLLKVWVIGPPGSGKTYLSCHLAVKMNVPHIELDNLYWRDNWDRPQESDFIERVERVAQGDQWIIDGYYHQVSDLLREKATVIVLMKASLPVLLTRVVCRSLHRVLTRQKVCGNNNENFYFLVSKDG